MVVAEACIAKGASPHRYPHLVRYWIVRRTAVYDRSLHRAILVLCQRQELALGWLGSNEVSPYRHQVKEFYRDSIAMPCGLVLPTARAKATFAARRWAKQDGYREAVAPHSEGLAAAGGLPWKRRPTTIQP